MTKSVFQDIHPQRTPTITNRKRKEREETEDIDVLVKIENNDNTPYRKAVGIFSTYKGPVLDLSTLAGNISF